ncbi:MAG: TAXI family TRAP transporter solute-binding subunit [Candidatus Acidiferrales bacterium]
MSRRIVCYLFSLLVSLFALPPAARAAIDPGCQAVAPNHRLLTGPAGLNYDRVGQAIVTAYNSQHSGQDQLTACTDEGSIESVQLLSEGQAALAIVQSDVAHQAWFNHALRSALDAKQPCLLTPFKFPPGDSRIRLIVPLFTEAVHVLVRPHLYISNVADLRGRRIWAGQPGAGGYLTAERVLAAAGLRMCDVALVPAIAGSAHSTATLQDVLGDLQKMDIDAVFFTGAVPTQAIHDVFEPPDGEEPGAEIQFLPLSVAMVSELSEDSSYVETMIRKNEYAPDVPGAQGVATVGVEALLVTSEDKDMAAVAESMVTFLAGNMDSVRAHIPKDQPALARLPLVDLPTPSALSRRYFFHPARQFFFKDPWDYWRRAIAWTAVIAILLIGLFCWQRKRFGSRIMKWPTLLFASLVFVLVWVPTAFLMWHFERHVNGDFTSVGRALLLVLFVYFPPFIGKTAMTGNGQMTVTIARYLLVGLFGGAIWPSAKNLVSAWMWPRLSNWLRGGEFARPKT